MAAAAKVGSPRATGKVHIGARTLELPRALNPVGASAPLPMRPQRAPELPLLLVLVVLVSMHSSCIAQWTPGPAGGTYCPDPLARDDPTFSDSDGNSCFDQRSAATINGISTPSGYCCPEELPDCPLGTGPDGYTSYTMPDGSPCCDADQYTDTASGADIRSACCATCGWVDVCDPYVNTIAKESQTLEFVPLPAAPDPANYSYEYTLRAETRAKGPCTKIIQAPASKHIVLTFISGGGTGTSVRILDAARSRPFGAKPFC